MAYVVFDRTCVVRKGPREYAEPFVHCGDKQLTFSKAAAAYLTQRAVLLLWDKDAGRVAARPTEDMTKGFRIYHKSGGQCAIGCTQFLRALCIAGIKSLPAAWTGEQIEWSIPKEVRNEQD